MFFQAQSLQKICLAMFTVASLTICRADPKAVENVPVLQENENTPAVRHTDWRNALHVEFKYIPSTPANPAVAPDATPEIPADSEVVVLPKYVVRDAAPDYRELEKSMRPPSMGADKVMEKLGIGVHEVKFRHFSIGCATIFFLPVSLGLSW